ncbi:MAG: hypothetical protein NVS1B10_08360 [Candidatus Saccharimonadales bacterium]
MILVAALACDQAAYDHLYREIVLQAIESKLSLYDLEQRNHNIEFLRKLCRGQKSSYERGKPWKTLKAQNKSKNS